MLKNVKIKAAAEWDSSGRLAVQPSLRVCAPQSALTKHFNKKVATLASLNSCKEVIQLHVSL